MLFIDNGMDKSKRLFEDGTSTRFASWVCNKNKGPLKKRLTQPNQWAFGVRKRRTMGNSSLDHRLHQPPIVAKHQPPQIYTSNSVMMTAKPPPSPRHYRIEERESRMYKQESIQWERHMNIEKECGERKIVIDYELIIPTTRSFSLYFFPFSI